MPPPTRIDPFVRQAWNRGRHERVVRVTLEVDLPEGLPDEGIEQFVNWILDHPDGAQRLRIGADDPPSVRVKDFQVTGAKPPEKKRFMSVGGARSSQGLSG